ncbi:hypothetical protein B0H14DRAFT_2986948 [Mycena olivaceomarginata]|nr:hypothetical protein B0H14DRAFT_2986948 [Mycena olivaceomarginata]
MSTTTVSRTVHSKVHSRAPPKPPLPVARRRPQQRQYVFDDAVNTEGGFEAAVAFFNAPSPPVNADIKSTDVGPFTIFYHPTFPRHLQRITRLRGTFYIGRCGQGVRSIMPDWAQQGIVVKIPGLTGEWGECQALTILPSTRVRLTYYDTPGSKLHSCRTNLFNSSVCCASTTAGRSEFGRHEIATEVCIML